MKVEPISQCQRTNNAWLEIDRGALVHNACTIRKMIGPGVFLLAVVKSDAYGMGLAEISSILNECGADGFGVSDVAEGSRLRELFPDARIVILGPSFLDNVEEILDKHLEPIASSMDFLRRLNDAASIRGVQADVHLMIDTGMGRIGVWHEKGEGFFRQLRECRSVSIKGVASHFAALGSRDLTFSRTQLERFNVFLTKLSDLGFQIPRAHMASSAALLRLPESRLNMVRIGILFYGIYPAPGPHRLALRPAVSWKTRIAFIKEVEPGRTISYGATYVADRRTRIATLPVGYAHGYDRSLSKKGEVLIGSRRCPVAGVVTMDQMMVDLGPASSAKVDDEAVLIGVQGAQEISLNEVAKKAGTIPYELLCRIRVSKRYT